MFIVYKTQWVLKQNANYPNLYKHMLLSCMYGLKSKSGCNILALIVYLLNSDLFHIYT